MTRYSFQTLFFEASRRCNFSCPMCMVGSNDPATVRRSATRELTTSEIEERLLAHAREIGIDTITWSGGEFMLRPDAVELVRLATRHGYSSIVTTNGSRADRQMLEWRSSSGAPSSRRTAPPCFSAARATPSASCGGG